MERVEMKLVKVVLLILVGACAIDGFGENWMKWRGPQRNGISSESEWTPAALRSDAKIVWRGNVGSGHSSFTIRDDKLYTMGNADEQDIVYCLDSQTGAELWKYTYDCKKGNYSGPRSTPVLDGDRLYTLSRDGQAHCINVDKRKLEWRRNIVESEGVEIPSWGLASSALIAGDLVLYNAGSDGIALERDTGKTVWIGNPKNSSYASPIVYSDGATECAAMFNAKAINAVVAESGQRLWSFPWDTKYDVKAADPIVSGGKMFISSGYGAGGCLLDISGPKPRQIWKNGNMANHFNSCVLIDGHLYGVSGNTGSGDLVCLEFATGNEKWRHGKGYEGLMAADGKLIIMDRKGFLTIAEATTDGYKELASSQVLTDRGAKNWTVPVLANGYIYCRNSKGDIVCVDVSK
jgi:outer membrane protein assembly factor BamB